MDCTCGKGKAVCSCADTKPPVWPDFIAPLQYPDAEAENWVEPRLPDFRLIWKVARECGYAVGLHGSMARDCDMIAAPWVEEAVPPLVLVDRLCKALNAHIVGFIERKPLGRIAVILGCDGYIKAIDLSIMPKGETNGSE